MMKKIIIGVVVVVVFSVAYYGISPFFINIKADEAAPTPKSEVPVNSGKIQSSVVMKDTSSMKKNESGIVGTTAHPASGSVRVITTETGAVVRYENFKTINGPDLYVYLAKDLDAKEYVNLGKLKGTEGNVNYDVPTGVNVNDYKYVMVWCKIFGVLFNYADISKL